MQLFWSGRRFNKIALFQHYPAMAISNPKTRADGQISALAGELFVAAELLKRDIQTSVTFGNAKAIDLLAYNPKLDYTFPVQVKALRKPNYFLIKRDRVHTAHIYVFVLLNKPGEPVRYFIVPGSVLANEADRFGKDFAHATMPGIHPKRLTEFENAWHHFDKIPVVAVPLATDAG